MPSDPAARLSAALQGRYRIERLLGEGGTATVYLADDVRNERKVAVKVLAPELAAVVGADRFLAEIKTTANLQHPHILPLFESGEADGLLFYVMPHVEGESVRDRIRKEGPLPVEDSLRIATECGDALAHAHQRGVIHRDVKPGNILLSAGHAVVADFGVARALEAAGGGDALTSTGVSLGTVGYMSPEQASGQREVDARADVYALGCLLYEMLAGEAPFQGATPYAVLARQLEGPPSITKGRRSVPEAVERVIGKACEPTPGDRFRSAEEFVQALRDAGRQPAGAGRRGKRTVVVLGAAATVVLIGLGAWAAISRPFGAPTGDARPRLSVLPLDNLSTDPENAFFAAGIHEEILTLLSRIEAIETISRTSVLRYQDTEKSPTEIAEELGISWILEGSIQVVGDDVRFNAQLSNAREDRSLWADTYYRELSDILQIQTDLAIRVVEEIGGVLTAEERAQLAQRPTDNEEAYAHYLRGHDLRARLFSEQEALAAADAYQRAVELDPTFNGAWARLVQMRAWLAWVWAWPGGTWRRRRARSTPPGPISERRAWSPGDGGLCGRSSRDA